MPIPALEPEQLRLAPFLGRAAVDAGLLTKRQLQSKPWVRLLRSVYVHGDLPVTDLVRARALLLVVPGRSVVAGLTAAWLHGAWQPLPGRSVPLQYARPRAATSSRPAGTYLSRRVLHVDGTCLSDLVEVGGIVAVSPLRTCFDLMRARNLVEAVVAADAFARAGVVDLPWLAAYVGMHRRWPGVRRSSLAVELSSAESRSPGETRLRMVVVLAGFPVPLVNPPVFTGDPPTLVGYPDLVIVVKYPVLGLEYDGAYHDDHHQRQADNRRENTLTRAGLPLLRYGAESVRRDRELIVADITAMTGLRPTAYLRDEDFRRPPPPIAW
ncbi:MAG: DUF2726 domain-containing protein [Jiangellaceae bacterium]